MDETGMITPEQMEELENVLRGPVEAALESGIIRKLNKMQVLQEQMSIAMETKIPEIDNTLKKVHLHMNMCLGESSDSNQVPPSIKDTKEEYYRKIIEANAEIEKIKKAEMEKREKAEMERNLKAVQKERESAAAMERSLAQMKKSFLKKMATVEIERCKAAEMEKERQSKAIEMTMERTVTTEIDSSSNDHSPFLGLRTRYNMMKSPGTRDQVTVNKPEEDVQLPKKIPQTTKKTPTNASTKTPKLDKIRSEPEEDMVIRASYHVKDGLIGTDNLIVGRKVWALKQRLWRRAVVIEVKIGVNLGATKYKVKFTDSMKGQRFIVHPAHHLACVDTTLLYKWEPLFVGARVAAHYQDQGVFSAIVVEQACSANFDRFLIFFDDGDKIYCHRHIIFMVYGPQAELWRHFPEKSTHSGLTTSFVKELLTEKRRIMLIMEQNQPINIECMGEYKEARVIKIDKSLAWITYLEDNTREWIYRGSFRLEEFSKHKRGIRSTKFSLDAISDPRFEYAEVSLDLPKQIKDDKRGRPKTYRLTTPGKFFGKSAKQQEEMEKEDSIASDTNLIDLVVGDDEKSTDADDEEGIRSSSTESNFTIALRSKTRETRNKCLTKRRTSKVGSAPDDEDSDDAPLVSFRSKRSERRPSKSSAFGRVLSQRTTLPNRRFIQVEDHRCGRDCLKNSNLYHPILDSLKGLNPLQKPVRANWKRNFKKGRGRRQHLVFYVSPCGRTCDNMDEVLDCLDFLSIEYLTADHFSFLVGIRTDYRFDMKPSDAMFFTEDYSKGAEDIAVSCVNKISNAPPPGIPYSNQRIPDKNVKINTDPAFQVCCSCTDGCKDHNKCECQQLTIQAAKCAGESSNFVGYKYKLLHNSLIAGIYECNQNCKCNMSCGNRVVQVGLQQRLQLFKTFSKGWGIRCLNDIAEGAFVCIYTGKIQTDHFSETAGKEMGDEYFADLDHIETAEKVKDQAAKDENDSSGIESLEENEAFEKIGKKNRKKKKETPPRNVDTTDTDFSDPEHPSHIPVPPGYYERDSDGNRKPPPMPPVKLKSPEKKGSDENINSQTRKYFGDEAPYTIDAKQTGNLGRYLNHSCKPNLFVQNVFIDTHDLRFPWVAFFSSSLIRAGTELTWDYCYDMGSVPSKRIYCYCGEPGCRKVLL